MKESLIKLGLSSNEAVVYLALLPLGSTPVGALIRQTSLHRYVIYETLRKLKERGLVSEAEKSGRAWYAAASPDAFIREANEKLALAQSILPKLKAKAQSPEQEVLVYEGIEGFRSAHRDLIEKLPVGGEFLGLGIAGKDWFEPMGGVAAVERFDKASLKKKIFIKLLTYADNAKWLVKIGYLEKNKNVELRILPEKLHSPANTTIWGDHIHIIIFGDSPTVIDIKNAAVAKNFRDYFNKFWHVAKKVKAA